jgi:hypothetical protein
MDLASLSIEWTPLLPPWAILAFAALGSVLVGLGAWRRARGILWRAAAVAVVAAALANPSLIDEEREKLADVAVLLIDESASQAIAPRPLQSAAASAEMERLIRALPDTELRVVRAGRAGPGGEEGTRLFEALGEALSDVPNRRLAGVIAITDGQVHDVPENVGAAGFDAPWHVLLTGLPEDGDRRLTLPNVPTFGLVGKPIAITVRIDDLPGAALTGPVPVALWKDGEPLPPVEVPLGVDFEIELPIDHGGPQVFEIAVDKGPRELSLVNNRAIAVVNGVRDRLRVLLISGEPYPGERTWRSLLKADTAVDLVHFTILRPPEKQDGTPVNELSLIAFPTRELFEAKLDEFDLVIFDRYRRGGVLPRAYFENIVDYVRAGGALLESSGADYAGPLSLYQSPLSEVLPAEPTGRVIERGFRPVVSVLGQRHPVTADLPGAMSEGAMSEAGEGTAAVPRWGRWFRQVDTRLKRGTAVLEGVDGRPLLVLDRVGEGRVAQLLSDQIWLWSRGFEGGGPQLELLRRVAHWLMKEPELEEEDLRATVAQGRLQIARRSLEEDPGSVTVTTPSGASLALELGPDGPGRASAAMAADEIGLYRVSDGDRHAFAASGELNPLEFTDLRATAERLGKLADATGGAILALSQEPHPRVRKVASGRDTAGPGWLGLRANEDYVVRGVSQTPLVPPILVLGAGLGALLLAWWREGR